jgi:hypothetical protein
VTKPGIGDLLNGVAASLRESVLPEMPVSPARRQVQMAIAIIRRVAAVWDRVGSYLYEDNRDIEAALHRVRDILDRSGNQTSPAITSLRRRIDAVDRNALAVREYPPMISLETRNVELQHLLVELQEALHPSLPATAAGQIASAEQSEIESILRALFRRMLEREAEITTPPLPRNK